MIYKIKGENYSLQIDSLGAELISSEYKDEEYLYQRDTKYWHRSSPILFPIVGRLKNNNYKYNDKSYSLPLHGFARHYDFELENRDSSSITFVLKENKETKKHYPFNFSLFLTYTIHKDYFEITYKVTSSEDILFSLGAHPAFNLFSTIEDSYLEFEEDEEKELIYFDTKINRISNKTKEFSSSKTINLKKDSFTNDALIFKNLKSKKVTLKNKNNSKSVSVNFDGFEYIAFWAPLGASFVCIEPWCGIADYEDTNYKLEDKISIIKLNKNEVFQKSMSISFS